MERSKRRETGQALVTDWLGGKESAGQELCTRMRWPVPRAGHEGESWVRTPGSGMLRWLGLGIEYGLELEE